MTEKPPTTQGGTDEKMDITDGLNPEQLDAVTSTEGYVRVIAGAGSGKTRALTRRFAWLVEALGVLPSHILCVTFTNKAANEMRHRIHALTGDNDTGYINTFHGFCAAVLQEDANAVGYPKNFLVLDNPDIDDILRIIYAERGLTLRDMTYAKARDMFEIRKLIKEPLYYEDLIALPLDILKNKYDNATETDDVLFYGYLYQQKKCFGLDYNDLIKFVLRIFDKNEEIRLKWQKRLEYIMIDEFQDIDPPQYELMEVLCAHHKNLFVVGDPDQTIYTWRGANVKFLLDFDKRFPGTKTIMMMRNYRSTESIIETVNRLISANEHRIKKDLIPMGEEGTTVTCFHGDTPEEEAAWIAKRINTMHENGTPYGYIAILYRAHYLSRALETEFINAKIPYVMYAGVQFYSRAEIKDALCYLRMLIHRDDLSFRRVINKPKRNMGERRMKFLESEAEKSGCTLWEALNANIENEIFKGTKAPAFIDLIEKWTQQGDRPVSEILNGILDKSGYEAMMRTEGDQARLDNLAELKQSVHEYETTCGEECTLEHYLVHAAMFTDADRASGDAVKLMTVHAAKGLEFPIVFLCGLNEGIFPSRKVLTLHAMEEERRLAFVAMTRAGKELYLTEAHGTDHGAPRYPSRFILDADPLISDGERSYLQHVKRPPDEFLAETRARIALTTKWLKSDAPDALMPVGTPVAHKIFGKGRIIGIDIGEQSYEIEFERLPTPRRLAFTAPLERSDTLRG